MGLGLKGASFLPARGHGMWPWNGASGEEQDWSKGRTLQEGDAALPRVDRKARAGRSGLWSATAPACCDPEPRRPQVSTGVPTVEPRAAPANATPTGPCRGASRPEPGAHAPHLPADEESRENLGVRWPPRAVVVTRGHSGHTVRGRRTRSQLTSPHDPGAVLSCPRAVTEEGPQPGRDCGLCFPVRVKGATKVLLLGPRRTPRGKELPGARPTAGLLALLLMNEWLAQLVSLLNEPPRLIRLGEWTEEKNESMNRAVPASRPCGEGRAGEASPASGRSQRPGVRARDSPLNHPQRG